MLGVPGSTSPTAGVARHFHPFHPSGASEPQMTLSEQKARLREEASARRDALPAGTRAAAAAAMAAGGLDFLGRSVSGAVSGYHTVGSEADCLPLLARLSGEGHAVALPVVARRAAPLVFRRWRAGEALTGGVLGIPVPGDDAPLIEPDILLVPLLAFDRAGFRLGYGGGYYDRTLADLRARKRIVAIGFAYAAQEVETVPHDRLDARLDWVLTEAGAIATGERDHAASVRR